MLVVAPHVSWTDVLVLTAVAPAGFVARSDLLEWGLLGALARRMRVIPIARERLRELPVVVARIRDRLAAGGDGRGVPGGHHVVRQGVRRIPSGAVPGRDRRPAPGATGRAPVRRRRRDDRHQPGVRRRRDDRRLVAAAAAAPGRRGGSGARPARAARLRSPRPRRAVRTVRAAERRRSRTRQARPRRPRHRRPGETPGRTVRAAGAEPDPLSWSGHDLEPRRSLRHLEDRLPRSRRDHADAARGRVGDDGGLRDGRQRVLPARVGTRGAPPRRGGPGVRRRGPRRPSLGGRLHLGGARRATTSRSRASTGRAATPIRAVAG